MKKTLNWLEKEYGGAVAYLKTIGVSGETEQKLLDKFVDNSDM